MKAYLFLKSNGRSPLIEHFEATSDKLELASMRSAIVRLVTREGRLPYPYAERIDGKICALRTVQGNQSIYYFREADTIILLDGYKKKSQRIDRRMLQNIRNHYQEYLRTQHRAIYIP